MGSIILKNVRCDGRLSVIHIESGRIKKICPAEDWPGGSACETGPDTETVDCKGRTAVPAFVNMHTHAAMSLMRGAEEDVLFQEWLRRIWEMEEGVDAEFVYWGTKVACLEMIRTGTATFNDQYWFTPAARKAAVETGIRPVLSYVAIDRNDRNETERQKEQCLKTFEDFRKIDDGAVFSAAFHAIYSVSEELMLWTSEFARRNGLKLHIHLCETEKEVLDCKAGHGGLSPVEYLDRLGILDSDVIAAHTLWLSEKDVEILGSRGVSCVHNINSNAKLSSGYRFFYNELRDAGANVCLGTDGCASSNNLDILEAMKTSALFQKAWRGDPKALPLDELMSLATAGGAKALGLDTGKLEEGKLADICIVDTDNTFFLSPGSFLSNFIYSAHSDCITSMIAGGRFVMRDRTIPGSGDIITSARGQLSKIQ